MPNLRRVHTVGSTGRHSPDKAGVRKMDARTNSLIFELGTLRAICGRRPSDQAATRIQALEAELEPKNCAYPIRPTSRMRLAG